MLTNMAHATYPCIYFVFVILGMWCQLYFLDPLWGKFFGENQNTSTRANDKQYGEILLNKPEQLGSNKSSPRSRIVLANIDIKFDDPEIERNGSYESAGL